MTTISSNFSLTVEGVASNDPHAMEELYELVRGYLGRALGTKVGADAIADRVHEAFMEIVRTIQSGGLREPERFMGFLRVVAQRKRAHAVRREMRERLNVCELVEAVGEIGRAHV